MGIDLLSDAGTASMLEPHPTSQALSPTPGCQVAVASGNVSSQLDGQAFPGGQLHPMLMIQQLYSWAAKDQDKLAWKKALPEVSINKDFPYQPFEV